MTRRVLLALLVLWPRPVAAQISVPNTFVVNTVANPDQVNENFQALGTQALNRTGGTMTGLLTTQNLVPSSDNLYNLGTLAVQYHDLFVKGTATLANLVFLNSSVAGPLVPQTDIAYDLGTAALRWRTLYAATGTVTTMAAASYATNAPDNFLNLASGTNGLRVQANNGVGTNLVLTNGGALSWNGGTVIVSSSNVVQTTQANTWTTGQQIFQGTGAIATPISVQNTSAGGGQLNFSTFGGVVGPAAAGDAMVSNSVGHLFVSPNAATKCVYVVPGIWTGTVGASICPGVIGLTGTTTITGGVRTPALTGPNTLPSGNVNDYSPVGMHTSTVLRVTGNADNTSTITGIGAGEEGERLLVCATNTNAVNFTNDSVLSAPANNIHYDVTRYTGGSIQLRNGCAEFLYMTLVGGIPRWHLIGGM